MESCLNVLVGEDWVLGASDKRPETDENAGQMEEVIEFGMAKSSRESGSTGPGSPQSCSKCSSKCSSGDGRKSVAVGDMKALLKGIQLQVGDLDLGSTVGTGTFGRVRVVSLRAQGSMPMALKIMKKAKVLKMKQVEHVRCEMAILNQVEHPFIVNLLRTWQDQQRLYLLMEYVNGGELFTLIKKEGRLEDSHAKFYAAQVTLAFEYLHSLKVAYRDLKPENTLIDHSGFMRITDFGFAKVVEERTYTMCGTPEYLAPEVIRTQGHGCGIDWWALGILIYEMLEGESPFASSSVTEIYRKAIAMKVEYSKNFSIKVKDLVSRLLKERSSRLGCCGREAAEIKEHKWFKDISWKDMYEKDVEAPWLPEVCGASDTSMYMRYKESVEVAPEISSQDQKLFDFAPFN